MKNYTGKNDNAIKTEVRKDVLSFLLGVLKTEYGEENVRQVATSEYGFIVGDTTVDGSPNDIVVTLSPTIKEWRDRRTEKKFFPQYILDDEAEIYEKSVKEKEEKAEEEKKKKEEKKARDKAKREEEKAKKEQALKDKLEDTGEDEV